MEQPLLAKEDSSIQESDNAFRTWGVVVQSGTAMPAKGKKAASLQLQSEMEKLCQGLSQQISERTYFQAHCVNKRMNGQLLLSQQSRLNLSGLSIKADISGVPDVSGIPDALVGIQIEGFASANIQVWNLKSGRRVFQENLKVSAQSGVQDALLDRLAREFPYRGYVLERTGKKVRLNMGTDQGIHVGQFLEVIDEQNTVLEVTKILDKDLSEAEIISSTSKKPIEAFNKISLDDAVPQGTDTRQHMLGSATWQAGLGLGIMQLQTQAHGQPQTNRIYKFKSTPALEFSLAQRNFFLTAQYAIAANSDASVGYTSLRAGFPVWIAGQHTRSWLLSLGAWVSQFTVTIKKVNESKTPLPLEYRPLDNSSRGAGFVELKYQRNIQDKLRLSFAFEGYYPLWLSGQLSGMWPYSFGAGIEPGLQWWWNPRIIFDVALRMQWAKLPISDDDGTQETQALGLARVYYSF